MGSKEITFTMEGLILGLIIYVALCPVSIAYACLEQGGMYFCFDER